MGVFGVSKVLRSVTLSKSFFREPGKFSGVFRMKWTVKDWETGLISQSTVAGNPGGNYGINIHKTEAIY